MVRFTNSGTEACMGMLRLVRAYTNREKIIKFEVTSTSTGALRTQTSLAPHRLQHARAYAREAAEQTLPGCCRRSPHPDTKVSR